MYLGDVMVVTLVAKVKLTTMEPKVLYPADSVDEERIAMLAGIVQLVSAALDRTQDTSETDIHFMKSGRGVIGYSKQGPSVIICEGDSESETNDALKSVLNSLNDSDVDISKLLEKTIQKRGKEIGELWK